MSIGGNFMKKYIVASLFILSLIIIGLISYNLFKPTYYKIYLTNNESSDLNINYNGLITKGFQNGSLSITIDYLSLDNIDHYALYVDGEKEPFLGWGKTKSISIYDKNLNKDYSIVNIMLKNKENLYIYFYDNIETNNVIAKYKLNIEKIN